jgi:two-component system, NarL family, response regulator DesR
VPRVLIAEEKHMIRGALAALLRLEPDIQLVAEVDRQDSIVPTAMVSRPDVAILTADGMAVAAELHRTLPGCHTLVLASEARPWLLRQALSAHVSGFILNDEPPAQLAEAIRKVVAGERIFNPDLMLRALDTGGTPLTARELEVLRLLASGAESSDIARSLSLSVGTVRNYLTSVVTKLDARNRVDAIRIASHAGWLP